MREQTPHTQVVPLDGVATECRFSNAVLGYENCISQYYTHYSRDYSENS